MTEAGPGTHFVYDEEFATTPPGSMGKLVPGTEARLVDPATGEDVAPGEVGELLVRGLQVMVGYLDNPAATAETITDGWLHTGDIARIDENGDYCVVDRLKELIKYKGYQVAPVELEALLLTHPDVLDAAVIAMPHPPRAKRRRPSSSAGATARRRAAWRGWPSGSRRIRSCAP
jgi:acyl-CoA synthetase (AMP-forming)/AMP-acid ligase II